ncbi:MAG: hypothetical protein LUG16_01080, partial [Candidatus Gastranaerophilales bacterium]|nr:hypothetical protein [Candidatus Gastranaerophilales bacterium]
TSLATTKEGRAAVVSQFKPNAMKAKLTQPNVKTGKKRKISEQERIKDFKKSQEGIRRANLSDEQIQQEFQAHFDKAFDEMGIPKDQRPKLKIIDSKETLGGRYTSDNNVLSLNKNAYKAGVFELDDVCAHEATHYKESLLRARLSQDKVNQTVQDELISRIMNGESEEIIKSGGILGAETMKPPKMNSTMRADFAELAKSKMYNQANFKADDLSSELTALMDKYPDFISQYNSKDEALQILKDYSTSHNVRFKSFTNQGSVKDIAATMPALTPEEELQAVQSLKNSIPTLEGNGVNGSFANSFFGSQKAYNQYQFSPEEVLAQQNGNKHLISQLELEMQNMKNNGTLNAEQEKIILDKINRAQATIDYKTKGLEYYTKYEQHLHNPSDTKIAKELSNLEKELKTLEDATKARKEIELISINLPANIYALLSQLSE